MSWDGVLRALEASVSEAERALDEGSWERGAAPWRPPEGPLAAPGAPEAARLEELATRSAACRRRLLAAMAGITAELGADRRLRDGARGYLMSQSLTRPAPGAGRMSA